MSFSGRLCQQFPLKSPQPPIKQKKTFLPRSGFTSSFSGFTTSFSPTFTLKRLEEVYGKLEVSSKPVQLSYLSVLGFWNLFSTTVNLHVISQAN